MAYVEVDAEALMARGKKVFDRVERASIVESELSDTVSENDPA
jgi:hypothetical protein